MLEVGKQAPHFNLMDQNGKTHHLTDYKGQWVILYFYPKDMTPGCTTEACNFRDEFPAFKKLDAVILGISKDSVQRHKKFTEKYQLPFTLLSDEKGNVCEDYHIWKEKSMYGKTFMGIERSTYLINPKGEIARTFPRVKVKEHAAELLEALNELR